MSAVEDNAVKQTSLTRAYACPNTCTLTARRTG